MSNVLPNRLAVYLTAAIALIGGLAPVIANLDWQSTAGIIAGLLVILTIVREWLVNWGKWERGEGDRLLPGELDEFDEDEAEPIPESVKEAAALPASAAQEASGASGSDVAGSPPPTR